MTKKRNRRPQPLAPPPQSSALRSRKRARQVTTKFHKFTQERDAAVARAKAGGCHVGDGEGSSDQDADGEIDLVNVNDTNDSLSSSQIALIDEVKKWDEKICEIGGREEYQRASQMNTSLFSTSKWVMGILGRWGWLDGLPTKVSSGNGDSSVGLEKDSSTTDNKKTENLKKKAKKEKVPRRDVKLLEVGAINTQLLDAAARTRVKSNQQADDNQNRDLVTCNNNEKPSSSHTQRVYLLDILAIDLRSTDPRIKKMDFFELPLSTKQPYDAIVNSMVINCVTTPAQRGRMLSLCYHQLRPGGVCFLTLPKLCLIQSKFMSLSYFEEILTKGVGFEILRGVARESPKISFFVLRRPEKEDERDEGKKKWNHKYMCMPHIRRGKKFRNTFAVTLDKEELVG